MFSVISASSISNEAYHVTLLPILLVGTAAIFIMFFFVVSSMSTVIEAEYRSSSVESPLSSYAGIVMVFSTSHPLLVCAYIYHDLLKSVV